MGFANENWLNLANRVDLTLHAGQAIAIFLNLLVQEAIWESSQNLSNGSSTSLQQQDIQHKWWLILNLLRLIEGFFATFATFMLIIISDNLLDLFKYFTAITFISSFDNIVFDLADMGVIGNRMYESATIVGTLKTGWTRLETQKRFLQLVSCENSYAIHRSLL